LIKFFRTISYGLINDFSDGINQYIPGDTFCCKFVEDTTVQGGEDSECEFFFSLEIERKRRYFISDSSMKICLGKGGDSDKR